MSAIAGIYLLDGGPVAPADLERMSERLAHRGPDGQNFWHKGPVGLLHRALWTTPESLRERLPLADETGDFVLTADARIDNRDELARVLGLAGPGEDTDSRLILGAYREWGERCPERLLGDFAFAIWDARRQVLFCARDPMGVCSFYYHHSGNLFVFASEIKALHCLPQVPQVLNEVRVADHLVGLFEDRAITFYQDIFRLPAAHSLTIDHRGGIRLRRYWTLDPSREVRLRSDDEYAEAFRDLFTTAVRCRVRSAFPVGSTLSGGLDSSSVACTARAVLAAEGRQPLHTFSAIFPSLPEKVLPLIDERRYMSAVLDMGGFAPHYVHADRLSPLADINSVLRHMDEAFLAPNLYMHWALYRAAQEHGVRVFLDGLDGDTTVSHGYGYLTELAATGRWLTLVREATALARKSHASYTPRRVIWEFGLRPLVPESIVQVWRRLRGRVRPPWGVDTIINPTFARRIGLEERARALLRESSRPAHTEKEKHRQGLTTGLYQHALELADKASAAFSVTARYPFFDRRLMEFCLALPPTQKLHQGQTRAILHWAMSSTLPPEVLSRFTKANLSPNFMFRLLDHDRPILDAAVADAPRIIGEYVDVALLRAAYRRYTEQNLQREQDALALYGVAILVLWLRASGLV